MESGKENLLKPCRFFKPNGLLGKKPFPEAMVPSTETGYSRNSDLFLYSEEYFQDDTPPLFPLTADDKIIQTYKKRQYIVIQKNIDIEIATTKIYNIEDFDSGISVEADQVVDQNGQVYVGYNSPDYLKKRHNIEGCDQELQKISGALKNLRNLQQEKTNMI